jgi:hypothetical protein
MALLFDLLRHSRAGRQQQLVCYHMSGRLLPLAWTLDCLERLSLYYSTPLRMNIVPAIIERKRSLETLSFHLPPPTSEHSTNSPVPYRAARAVQLEGCTRYCTASQRPLTVLTFCHIRSVGLGLASSLSWAGFWVVAFKGLRIANTV